MPKVDLAIMRLSCYEIKFRDDIPMNVSINEAVELAKKYSGEQSGTFVNGVLGKIFSQLSSQDGSGSGG
jgi:N utilization substance protein B